MDGKRKRDGEAETPRTGAEERKEAREKRREERAALEAAPWPPFFAVVWHRHSDDLSPVCFASSHRDAQRKVDALREELAIFLEAGGDFRCDEEMLHYGYATADGRCWEWNDEERAASPESESDEEGGRRQATIDLEELLYYRGERRGLLGADDTASMAFAAGNADRATHRKFSRGLKQLPYETVQTLRAIYVRAGSYSRIDGDSEGEKEESDSEDE